MRPALFWDIKRRRVVIVYRRFGTTSVKNYHTTPRNIPEERRSHQNRGGCLKSLSHFSEMCTWRKYIETCHTNAILSATDLSTLLSKQEQTPHMVLLTPMFPGLSLSLYLRGFELQSSTRSLTSCWRLQYSGMWRCVLRHKIGGVSEQPGASILYL
jgi:hypothetical protein